MKLVQHTAALAGALALTLVAGCGWFSKPAADTQANATTATKKSPLPGLDPEVPVRQKIVVLGDSITAGFGVFQLEAYPALLQTKVDAEGYNYEIVNAGESGDTSATALRRVDWLLDPNVRVLIVAVGGNDALRGIAPKATRENIAAIIEKAFAKNVAVLLCGMEAPPNLGEDFVVAFRSIFGGLERDYPAIRRMPFLLEGVAGEASLNQADGIHPTAAGQQIIAAHVYEQLKPVLDDLASRSGGQ